MSEPTTTNAAEALAIFNGLVKRYGQFVHDVPRVLAAAVAVEAARRAEEDALVAVRQARAPLEGELRARRSAVEAECATLLERARAEVERLRGEVTLLVGDKDRITGEVAELTARKAALADEVHGLVDARAALQPTKA